jgi:hypothetical protein
MNGQDLIEVTKNFSLSKARVAHPEISEEQMRKDFTTWKSGGKFPSYMFEGLVDIPTTLTEHPKPELSPISPFLTGGTEFAGHLFGSIPGGIKQTLSGMTSPLPSVTEFGIPTSAPADPKSILEEIPGVQTIERLAHAKSAADVGDILGEDIGNILPFIAAGAAKPKMPMMEEPDFYKSEPYKKFMAVMPDMKPETLEALYNSGHLTELAKYMQPTMRENLPILQDYMNDWYEHNYLGAINMHPDVAEGITGDRIIAELEKSKMTGELANTFPEYNKAIDAELTRYKGRKYSLPDAAKLLKILNDETKKYHNMTPSERMSAQEISGHVEALMSADKAVRDLIDERLHDLGHQGIPEARAEHGQLQELRNSIQKKVGLAEKKGALKPSYGGIFLRGFSRHPLVSAGILLGGVAAHEPMVPLVALPAIEAVRTWQARNMTLNDLMSGAWKELAKGGPERNIPTYQPRPPEPYIESDISRPPGLPPVSSFSPEEPPRGPITSGAPPERLLIPENVPTKYSGMNAQTLQEVYKYSPTAKTDPEFMEEMKKKNLLGREKATPSQSPESKAGITSETPTKTVAPPQLDYDSMSNKQLFEQAMKEGSPHTYSPAMEVLKQRHVEEELPKVTNFPFTQSEGFKHGRLPDVLEPDVSETLRGLGYSKEQIDRMSPKDMDDILRKRLGIDPLGELMKRMYPFLPK